MRVFVTLEESIVTYDSPRIGDRKQKGFLSQQQLTWLFCRAFLAQFYALEKGNMHFLKAGTKNGFCVNEQGNVVNAFKKNSSSPLGRVCKNLKMGDPLKSQESATKSNHGFQIDPFKSLRDFPFHVRAKRALKLRRNVCT